MADKKASKVVKKSAKKKTAKPSRAKVDVEGSFIRLDKRTSEVEGDIKRIVELLSEQLGEPFASKALEIVSRNQEAAPAAPAPDKA